ncbi:GCN5-related N-acetyltransferase [Thalassoporum mexicanum PCC 7367]|uniref:GNAT family N-acetyltransferase n=1 Tax=Thalassoporum mexicanum TaxID=3457544 RepID=UPI00029FD984|nr:GNAT family N-acetyltransferase [Pseudanabaena sp. PCC 7367]AFY69907.1 GCN5-related N-acetyltransferase [Pseudanabaena sp. PCC 7367]
MDNIQIVVSNWQSDRAIIEQIRRQVFHLEQGVATELDFDGEDATATQLLAFYAGQPAATTRIRYLSLNFEHESEHEPESQIAKIERLAVLTTYRRKGIGSKLMQAAIEVISDRGIKQVKIHAQAYVAKMYLQLGFEPQGEEFYEAGIAHLEMYKYL